MILHHFNLTSVTVAEWLASLALGSSPRETQPFVDFYLFIPQKSRSTATEMVSTTVQKQLTFSLQATISLPFKTEQALTLDLRDFLGPF